MQKGSSRADETKVRQLFPSSVTQQIGKHGSNGKALPVLPDYALVRDFSFNVWLAAVIA